MKINNSPRRKIASPPLGPETANPEPPTSPPAAQTPGTPQPRRTMTPQAPPSPPAPDIPKIELSIVGSSPDNMTYRVGIAPAANRDIQFLASQLTTIFRTQIDTFLQTEVPRVRGLANKKLYTTKLVRVEHPQGEGQGVLAVVPFQIHTRFENMVEQMATNDPFVNKKRAEQNDPEFLSFVKNTAGDERVEMQTNTKFDVKFQTVMATKPIREGQLQNYDLAVDLNQFSSHVNGDFLRIEFEKITQTIVFYQPGPKPLGVNEAPSRNVAASKIAQTIDPPVRPEITEQDLIPPFTVTEPQVDVGENPPIFTPEQLKLATRRRKKRSIENNQSYSKKLKNILYLKGSMNAYTRLSQMLYYHPGFSNDSLNEIISTLTNRKQAFCVNGFLDGYLKENWRENVDPTQVTYEQSRRHTRLPKDPSTGLRKGNEEAFLRDLDAFKINRRDAQGNVQSYPLKKTQKQDIMWLYTQQSAILGDQTGAGKSSQLIVAAHMRTRSAGWKEGSPTGGPAADINNTFGFSSGRVLVLTVPNVVEQFATNIRELLGNEVTISRDPSAGARWTILSYSQFQLNNQKSQALIASIKAQNFDVIIMDESHTLKNAGINTSRAVAEFADGIPYRWMASATVSANKPIDLWFPLKLIGHSLGEMSKRAFSSAYTNTEITGEDDQATAVDIVSIPQVMKFLRENIPNFDHLPTDSKLEAAEKEAARAIKPIVDQQVENVLNLKTMLVLTNVYRRKSKEEVWMDDALTALEREHEEQGQAFNREEYQRQHGNEISSRFPKLKQNSEFMPVESIGADVIQTMRTEAARYPDPLQQQLYYRMKLAEAKVPLTVKMATPILQSGKKVLVFSCFQESARQLHGHLESIVKSMNPSFECGYFMGDAETEERIASLESFKKADSPTKAMVIGVAAGGTGIDLPNVVTDVFVNDFPWTPKDADQAEGRAFRLNSTSDVHTTYVVVDNSPDRIFYSSLLKKQRLADIVQRIDKSYAEKVRNFQNVKAELTEAQKVYWDEVLRSIKDTIRVEDYLKSFQAAAMSMGWLKKALTLRRD